MSSPAYGNAFARAVAHRVGAPCLKEYRFHPTRQWRFDYAVPARRVAIEIEGGVWIYGRHNRAAGFVRDMEKYNAAAALGWRILRCQPSDLFAPAFMALIAQACRHESSEPT